jgi:hypothetical protein
MKPIPFVVILSAICVCTDACAFFGSARWEEEVRIGDGSKLIVERSQTRGGRHEIGQEVPVEKHVVSFSIPGSAKVITWASEFGRENGKSNLLPLALYVIGGVPYIVTTTAGCHAYNQWGRPNPPYVVLTFGGNVWRRIQSAELPTAITEANLVIGALTKATEVRLTKYSGPVPASEIKRINSEATNPDVRYLRVFVNGPIKVSQTVDCPDLNSPRYMNPKAPFPIEPNTNDK